MEMIQVPFQVASQLLNNYQAEQDPSRRVKKPKDIDINSEVLLEPGGCKLARSSIGGKVVYTVVDYSWDGRYAALMGLS